MIETVKHYPQQRFTIASIYDPVTGLIRIGLALASKVDVFKKKVGFQKARGRAISSHPTIEQVIAPNLSPREITRVTEEFAVALCDLKHLIHQRHS